MSWIHRLASSLRTRKLETGRQAKFYRLTNPGLKQMETEEARWQKLTKGVSKVLRFA